MHSDYRGNRLYSTGFTLIELLIVIVVIAILASITTVAFSGMRDRASQTKSLAAIKAYSDAFELYKIDHSGTLPVPDLAQQDNVAYTCLGDSYPAADGFAEGVCRMDLSGVPNGRVNPGMNATLQAVMSTLPDTKTPVVTMPGASGFKVRGAFYQMTSTDGAGSVLIWFYANGNQDCGKSDKLYYGGSRNVTMCLTGTDAD